MQANSIEICNTNSNGLLATKSIWGSTLKKFQNLCKFIKAKYLNKNIETPQISMHELDGVKRFLCLDFYLLDWRESIPDK